MFDSPSTHTHAHARAHTHTRTHARAHTHTHTDGDALQGLSKGLSSGRVVARDGPAPRRSWRARRPESAPAGGGFEPSPWSGYVTHISYF
jgi:hypothetical protein